MTGELLTVRGLAVSFGLFKALEDVSFSVRPGEIVGLLGPNGSGKSTALNAISGFLARSTGTVTLAGRDISDARVQTITDLGLVRTFQLPSMPHRMTVREVLKAGKRDDGGRFSPVSFGRDIDALLEEFKLSHVADNAASALSGGQKKLLSVATALRANPKLLCLDEPTAGVHVSLRSELIGVLRRYVERGGACLVVEHDMLFIRELCTRCIVLDRGEIVVDCAPDQLEHHPRVVEAYLGKAVEKGGMAR
ncbi:ATP-binding cassette domain-containing protein [Sinorhizobium sp. RAC02]|uniref:ABC transporter ATP-binding protein n=1 Tax=Sinorhizobium sp. RAC02 TaxID=1842534 RepID=UPI00083D9253|nr:ATP-binding cassette domain-containing protein [Sinorhizobium sp. RAC02]AOF92278.1 ABC transporter family protein [Sinorhizobium sp. RAC02]